MNFQAAFCSFRSAVLLFTNTICGHAFPALGLVGASIENVTKHFYEDVKEGDPGGHQCWDSGCSVEERGIGVHVTTTLCLGSIAIECDIKEVGVMR